METFDSDRYQKALTFAIEKHGPQIYGQMPYVHHLLAVERQLFIYCFHPLTPPELRKLPLNECEELLIAVLLHDVIEDTDTTRSQVVALFGERVGDMVWAVTNEPIPETIQDKKERRKAKFATTYPKIRDTPGALIVKLCDRIANFESCMDFRLTKNREKVAKLLKMYQDEYPSFKDNLQRGDQKHLNRMWGRLEVLMLQIQ